MALDSRAHLHSDSNTSFYAFGGSLSSSDQHQTEGGLSSSQLVFQGFVKVNDSQYHKVHQQAAGRMMQGGIGKVFSDSNDESLISFEDSYEAAAGGQGYEHNSNTIHAKCFVSNSHHPAVTRVDNHIVAAEDGRSYLTAKVNTRDDTLDYWFHSSDGADHHTALHKHPTLDDDSYTPPKKKQCTSSAKKSSKAKQPVVSKDPQSTAAKNRRERISERLKILQELVPNGTKVDLVTMLEKAIGYVKFLQLQVKVLAADEFWPVQGGKAPELSQVKDAIDAILSSQRSDRNSTSD